MKIYKKSFLVIAVLIVLTGAALAYVSVAENRKAVAVIDSSVKKWPVAMSLKMVQDKVLQGSNGRFSMALTVAADEIHQPDRPAVQHADLVVVIDRSGSMSGQKIHDARMAVVRLIERLTDRDRLAVVTYSNGVDTVWPLTNMTRMHRNQAIAAVQRVHTGGGTNLGGGLSQGIAALMKTAADGRQRKLILISDGLANQGITDPTVLGQMAADVVVQNGTVSTVGVGLDFNEILMTTIADHGAGRYYFLEDPQTFAQVFDKELQAARTVAASNIEIKIPQQEGLRLTNAGGFPITSQKNMAVIRPGDLLSGQERTIYLTFKAPTDRLRSFAIGGFEMQFLSNGVTSSLTHPTELRLTCLADEKEVTASIDKEAWGQQVVREDYNRLKEEVAADIRNGEKESALGKIRSYAARKGELNDSVGSDQVADNLEQDVKLLRQSVEDTFVGAPAAVAEKKKQRAKALQYESYQIRRDKK